MNRGTITGVLECVKESNTSRAITKLLQLRPVGPSVQNGLLSDQGIHN